MFVTWRVEATPVAGEERRTFTKIWMGWLLPLVKTVGNWSIRRNSYCGYLYANDVRIFSPDKCASIAGIPHSLFVTKGPIVIGWVLAFRMSIGPPARYEVI